MLVCIFHRCFNNCECSINYLPSSHSSSSSSLSSPATTSSAANATPASSIYHVKWIGWSCNQNVAEASNASSPRGQGGDHQKESPARSGKIAIVTQNANGPCPLLSLVNVLLLRGKISLPEGSEVVSAEQLTQYLGK